MNCIMTDIPNKMKKCKILIPQGERADYGISKPIIRRLRLQEWCKVKVLPLIPSSFGNSYFKAKAICIDWKPDIMLAVGDRIEMTGAVAAAFHSDIPIAHYGSGVTNTPISTYDDINRHCITLWSEIALCEDKNSAITTYVLWELINKVMISVKVREVDLESLNIHEVGITHMDDVIPDESLVPNEPYDLVAYNPTTMYKEEFSFTPKSKRVICVKPNSDPTMMDFVKYIKSLGCEYWGTVERMKYMGLLKNCQNFFTNSSSAYYEAPHFLKPEQIIIIGDRNKNRSTPIIKDKGASDRIVELLRKWWIK